MFWGRLGYTSFVSGRLLNPGRNGNRASHGTAPQQKHFHPEHRHRDVKGGGARAAVLGVNDGLVSDVALVLAVAGAHPAPSTVRLAGLVGLVGYQQGPPDGPVK